MNKAFSPYTVNYSTYRCFNECLGHDNVNYKQIKDVTVDRTHFKQGSVIFVGLSSDNDFPLFSVINKIYINTDVDALAQVKPEHFLIQVKHLETLQFDDHYQAYELENSEEVEFVKFNKIANYKTWKRIQTSGNKVYIVFNDYDNYVYHTY